MSNKDLISNLGRYLPLIIGLGLLLVISFLAPWGQIFELLEEVPLQLFVALAGFSALYYASKAVRFWYILRLLDIKTPFWMTSLLYISGQLVSFLPAGELYRSVLLKKHLGISISKSSPSVTIQGIVEAIVLLGFSIVGALVIGRNQVEVGIVGVLLVAIVVALQQGWLRKSYEHINKLPFMSVNKSKFQQFIQGHQVLVTPKSLLSLVVFSLVPVAAGIGTLYVASKAVDFDITYVQAMIGYSLPSIISGLSFLPGGLGVSEGSTIGMVQLFGASAAVAMTITLLVRIFSLVAGLIYGLLAQLILYTMKRTS